MSVYEIIPYAGMEHVRCGEDCGEDCNYLGLVDGVCIITFDPSGLEIARRDTDSEDESESWSEDSTTALGEEVDEIYPYSFKDLVSQYLNNFHNYHEYHTQFEECQDHTFALIRYDIDERYSLFTDGMFYFVANMVTMMIDRIISDLSSGLQLGDSNTRVHRLENNGIMFINSGDVSSVIIIRKS